MSVPLDWVHHNLRTGRVCVRYADDRRFTKHFDWVWVSDAEPHVSQAGRARVLERQCRSVHATIRGLVIGEGDDGPGQQYTPLTDAYRKVTYNPHRSGEFTYEDTGQAWIGGPGSLVFVTRGYAWERRPER